MFYVLNFELLGWGVGSVAFVLCLVLWGKWTKLTAAMAAIVALTIIVHAFYWFACGYYIGPRYWYAALAPMLVLSAAGIVTCTRKFDQIFPQGAAPQRIGFAVGFLCLCSFLVFTNWLAFNRYPEFRGYHGDYRTLAREERFQNSLVFVDTEYTREYESAFWLNDFSTHSTRPLFARDLGIETNRLVAAAYPGAKSTL